MHGRREFIWRSLAASALATCPLTSGALLAGGGATPNRVWRVLFDRDSDHAAAFAAEAARQGVPALPVGADVGGVWMHEIAPMWQQGTGVIAGLTGAVPLFCLELLARDYGMRVVYRARHAPSATGRARHSIVGPAALSRWWEARLAAAGARWASTAATLALACPDVPSSDARIDLLDVGSSSDSDRSLFSWVIAPGDVARAVARRQEPDRL